MDKLRGELIDVIEWLDDSRDTIVWRFPRYGNEIKMGAKLVVRESQAAVFINEGRLADAFHPGTYTLQTENMPVLSTLMGWKYGFESPFKAEVYFVNTRQFTDFKWGTQNPIMMRDPEFGMVRVRAFGAFAMRVVDPPALVRELVGTDPEFRTEEVSEYLRQLVVGRLGTTLAASGIPVLDMAAQQGALGERLVGTLNQDLAGVGVQLVKLIVENISLPPEVEQAVDKRTQMGVVGDLGRYTQFQAANAVEQAAKNPGGGAGEGLGVGMGMALGQQMAAGMAQPQQAQARTPEPGRPGSAGPPPLPAAEQWYLGVGGQQEGPFGRPELADRATNGTLGAATLVWRSGMTEWQPAGQVPELAPLFGAAPPPLPPRA